MRAIYSATFPLCLLFKISLLHILSEISLNIILCNSFIDPEKKNGFCLILVYVGRGRRLHQRWRKIYPLFHFDYFSVFFENAYRWWPVFDFLYFLLWVSFAETPFCDRQFDLRSRLLHSFISGLVKSPIKLLFRLLHRHFDSRYWKRTKIK